MSFARAITDRIFGFDVFVSYSRHDGIAYALKLEEELRRAGFRCFLDSKEMPPGEALQTSLRSALKRSSALILVASPGAVQHSRYMPQEFDYYSSTRQSSKIVPISIGRTLDDAAADLPMSQRVRSRADVIWITERPERLPDGPSGDVLKALIDSFRFTRRNTIRNRIVTATSAILAVLLVAAVWMGIRAENQRRIAVTERNRAQRTLSEADYQKAAEASKADRDEEALAYLSRAAENDLTNEMAAGRLLSLLLYRDWSAEQFSLAHGEPLVSGDFSSDGRFILTAGQSGNAKIWDARDGKLLQTLPHGGPILKAVFSRSGSHVATAGGKVVRIWESETGRQVGPDLAHEFPVTDLAFRPTRKFLATVCLGPAASEKAAIEAEEQGQEATQPGYAQLWEITTGLPSGSKLREGRGATHLAWHPQGRSLALGLRNWVQLWDPNANRAFFEPWKINSSFRHALSALKFDESGGRLIVSAGSYADGAMGEAGVDTVGLVRIWNTITGAALVPEVEGDPGASVSLYHEAWIRDVAVLTDSQGQEAMLQVYTATDDGKATRWRQSDGEGGDAATREGGSVQEKPGQHHFVAHARGAAVHEFPVERVLPHKMESLLTVANSRATGFGYARRWSELSDTTDGMSVLSQRMEQAGLITGAAWSPDGARVLTVGDDGFARLWWTTSMLAAEELIPKPAAAAGAGTPAEADSAKKPPGGALGSLETIGEYDYRAVQITLPPGTSLDGPLLAPELIAALAKVPQVIEAARARFLAFNGTDAWRLFRSPEGRWLVISKCGDMRSPATAAVWDLPASSCAGGLKFELPVQEVAFARDGARFAVSSGYNMGGTVRTFFTDGVRQAAPAIRGPGKPLYASFSPDGRRVLVSFSDDPMDNGTHIGIFDVETALALVEPRFEGPVDERIHFSPDGQRLSATLGDGEHLYDIPTPAGRAPDWLPELARVIARREVSPAGTVQRIPDVAPRLAALRGKINDSPDSPSKVVAQWMLGAPIERRVSPFASRTNRAALEAGIREKLDRADRAVRGPAEDPASDLFILLNETKALGDRTFGDPALVATLEDTATHLRQKLLAHLSTIVTKLQKTPDPDEASSTLQNLKNLRDLAPDDAAFTGKIDALQTQLAKPKAKGAHSSPPPQKPPEGRAHSVGE